jgi:hypothetical protein
VRNDRAAHRADDWQCVQLRIGEKQFYGLEERCLGVVYTKDRSRRSWGHAVYEHGADKCLRLFFHEDPRHWFVVIRSL